LSGKKAVLKNGENRLKNKPILVLLVVLTVLLAVLVVRSKSRVMPSAALESPTSANLSKTEPQVIDSNHGLPPRMPSEQVKAWEKQDLAERQLEFQNFLLPKEGSDSVLNIELKILPSCFPGDADAIGMDLKASPTFKLLGTLEGMSRGTLSESWEVPKDLFSKGSATTRFKLKARKEPLQLGFYVCTSKDGTSCQGKKVRDINDIFTEHLTKKSRAGQEERMIYYQYFLLDERGLRAFQGNPKGKAHFENLKKYAAERQFQGKDVNEGIDKAKEALETLISMPVKFEKETLIVSLPKYDAVECANMQRNVKQAVPVVNPTPTLKK